MNNIEIFDDFFSETQQDYFYNSIFGNDAEKLHPTVDFRVKREPTAIEDDYKPVSFMHILKSDAILSPHLENFASIPVTVCEKLNIFLKTIYYGRIFLTNPYNTDRKYAKPHTDMKIPHWVVLYYVNDSDGDTVFFDNNENIIDSVTPKRGRVVFFNGSILHGGGIPTKGPRCIVNFDIGV